MKSRGEGGREGGRIDCLGSRAWEGKKRKGVKRSRYSLVGWPWGWMGDGHCKHGKEGTNGVTWEPGQKIE